MPDRVREVLERLWTWVREAWGPADAETTSETARSARPRLRAGRFWSEFREGQREAEAASARLR